MGVEILDLVELVDPFDLGGGADHVCVGILDLVELVDPFICIGEAPVGHVCIGILDLVELADPFTCFAPEGNPYATAIAETTTRGPVVRPSPAEAIAEARRGTIWGNGDFPPFGRSHSIPNNTTNERTKTMSEAALAEQKAILEALLDVGVWAPGTMEAGLFVNNIVPGKATVFADLVLPTFDGYASKTTVDLFPPTLGNDGNWETVGKATLQWVCTGDTVQDNVYGMWFKDGTGAYLGAVAFDAPQIMGKAGDSVQGVVSASPRLFLDFAIAP